MPAAPYLFQPPRPDGIVFRYAVSWSPAVSFLSAQEIYISFLRYLVEREDFILLLHPVWARFVFLCMSHPSFSAPFPVALLEEGFGRGEVECLRNGVHGFVHIPMFLHST
jgi:hypothetical protein